MRAGRPRMKVLQGDSSRMALDNWRVGHLLRRAAFGPDAADVVRFADTPVSAVAAYLIDFEQQPDDVDAKIGQDA